MELFTVGYEGLNLDRFLSILRAHDIECLLDVRQMPLSRKKGFSKKALAAALSQQGFDYLHWQTLGCPRPIRDQYRADGNWRDYVERFSRYTGNARRSHRRPHRAGWRKALLPDVF